MADKSGSPVFQRAIIVLPDSPAEMESVFVEKLRGKRYKVATIPFFAYNISLGDVVECRPDDEGIGLFVESVLSKSGNKTFRIAFDGDRGIDDPQGRRFRDFLDSHGLLYEIFPPVVFSVNVPVGFDVEALVKKLDSMLESVPDFRWELGDPDPEVNWDGSEIESMPPRGG